jgi:Ankyrin repeats (many copies)/Ankyrin repeats (3 copies)
MNTTKQEIWFSARNAISYGDFRKLRDLISKNGERHNTIEPNYIPRENKELGSLLRMAVVHEIGYVNPRMCKALLEEGADPKEAGLASIACQTQNSESVLELLLANGADPNWGGRVPGSSETLLRSAISLSSQGCIPILLKYGADPNLRYKKGGLTPLMYAAIRVQTKVCVSLIKAGADIEAKGKEDNLTGPSYTALQLSVLKGIMQSSLILLKAGANPNKQDENGRTALHIAFYGTHNTELVGALLDYGADPHIKDNHGQSPLDIVKNTPTGTPGPSQLLKSSEKSKKLVIQAALRIKAKKRFEGVKEIEF